MVEPICRLYSLAAVETFQAGRAVHRHPDLKADFVLANPPFNDSDWRGELLKDDKRWVYGTPPADNASLEQTPVHQRRAA